MDSEERKAAVLEKMVRRRQWGMNYSAVEKTLSNVPKRFRQDARNDLQELVREGWVETHKNGACISLNPSKKEDIHRFLERRGSIERWLLDSLFR